MCCVVVVRDYRCVDGIVHTHVLSARGRCASRHGVDKHVIHNYIKAASRLIITNYMTIKMSYFPQVSLKALKAGL